jgi:hypothetical protein
MIDHAESIADGQDSRSVIWLRQMNAIAMESMDRLNLSERKAAMSLRWACVGLISVVVSACHGPSPDWNGTWKLSASKSNIPGPSLTVSIDSSGEYHTESGTSTGNFRCNGKEYPAVANITVSCAQGSASALEITLKKNGTKTSTAQWELSRDGKMLTIKSTSVEAGGSPKSKETEYMRISGSTGFAGGWKNTKPFESLPSLMQLTLTDGKMHYAFPEKAQYADPALDGRDTTVYGPGVPSGSTIAFKKQGSLDLLMAKKLNGQILNVGSLRITGDGRTLTETYWRPETPNVKAVLVYER